MFREALKQASGSPDAASDSKKKGRALYNFKPKDYGNLSKRKRRLSEIEEYEGDKHEISVFNTDRESKRLNQIDTNSKGARKEAMINIRRPLTDQDPFKKWTIDHKVKQINKWTERVCLNTIIAW